MVNRLGYYHVKLETNIPLHRVIAEQFIDNLTNFRESNIQIETKLITNFRILDGLIIR
jgi:hypothetical protein